MIHIREKKAINRKVAEWRQLNGPGFFSQEYK